MNNDPRVRGLNCLAFVVKPVQRLCKYPLLLRELISQTDPSSEEHKLLNVLLLPSVAFLRSLTLSKVAFGKVSEAVGYVNEIQRQEEAKAQDKLNQIIQIEQSIEGADELALSGDANRYIGTLFTVLSLSLNVLHLFSENGRDHSLCLQEEAIRLHHDPLQ